MMRKTGAGVLWFCASILFTGVGWAEEGEPVSGQEAPAVAAPVDFKAKAQARVDELKGLPVEDIEKAVLQSEQAMQVLNQEAQAARFAARDLQEKMRLENPDVQAKYREIEEMRAKINAFIDELPEVKVQLETVQQAEVKLMEETWFRTSAMGLVASEDRRREFPSRPETVLDEPKPVTEDVTEAQKDLEP